MFEFPNILIRSVKDWERMKPVILGQNGAWRPTIWLRPDTPAPLRLEIERFRHAGLHGSDDPLAVLTM
ncbi:hypothetical protein HS088_TW01G00049 [Tripterygium wilfordii]|uniref:Uncharacterized protein n=1 Tax=Tripterygium wilfordii TaxID=458696 RepID=A0A7J7E0F5_TRIWF|nr:hypothetical protein HS088_TW01G00049 [Tripterygium wilfordii]